MTLETPHQSRPDSADQRSSVNRAHASRAGILGMSRQRIWIIPAGMLLVWVGLTVVIWKMNHDNAKVAALLDAGQRGLLISRQVNWSVINELKPLRRSRDTGKLGSEKQFVAEAGGLISNHPAVWFCGWVDANDICRQAVGPGSAAIKGMRITDNPNWADAINRSRSNDGGETAPVKIMAGAGPVLPCLWAGTDSRSDSPESGSAIIVGLKLDVVLANLPKQLPKHLAMQLSDDQHAFLSVPPEGQNPAVFAEDFGKSQTNVPVLGRTWSLSLFPDAAFVDQHISPSQMWVLWVWLAGSVLVLAGVWEAIRHRSSSDRRIVRYLTALEMVAETSAQVLKKVGSEGEVCRMLPEAARSVMSMSLAGVSALEEEGRKVRFIASAGVEPPVIGRVLPIDELPLLHQCVLERRAIACSDLQREGVPYNVELVEKFKLRSLLLLPLIAGDEILGVMTLGDTKPQKFTAADIRLAELWGGLAAVAIANDRLYGQTSQALAARNRLLQQRDALFALHEAMLQPESTEQILQQIADLAPGPTEVDLCMVILRTDKLDELIVSASTQHYASHIIGYRFGVEGTNSGHVLRDHQPLVVEDGPSSKTLHPFLRTQVPSGSVMYVPMMGAGPEPLGLLALLRKEPGTFSQEQLNLAQIFAARAATAIEIARLYEQTRRDADAKAMLLRELKHRVKNNLTGMIALLTMDQPRLPAPARKWLDRVVERARVLARSLDMISGRPDRLGLKEIVDQTIRSLDALRPASVEVHTEDVPVNLLLRTDRAVTVAMVLHELCYNAMAHGLADAGLLRVQAMVVGPDISSATAPGHSARGLRLEVIDDGRGFTTESLVEPIEQQESASAAREQGVALLSSRPGLGLNLVRDFVTRELRGKFSIDSHPGEGTVARVEFTLLEDELPSMV